METALRALVASLPPPPATAPAIVDERNHAPAPHFLFDMAAGTLEPYAGPGIQGLVDACAAVSTKAQIVALASARESLARTACANPREQCFRFTAGTSALLGFCFHLSPAAQGFRMRSQGMPFSARVRVAQEHRRCPIVVFVVDAGDDKGGRYPSLSLVTGDALARRSVVLLPSDALEVLVDGEAADEGTGSLVEDAECAVLYLACTRFSSSGAWASNFLLAPKFVA